LEGGESALLPSIAAALSTFFFVGVPCAFFLDGERFDENWSLLSLRTVAALLNLAV
jgi:hypothetical protein